MLSSLVVLKQIVKVTRQHRFRLFYYIITFYYIVSDMERTFEVEPKNATAYLGDVVMFSCKIGGIPRPHILWLKDNQEISTESANFVIHRDDGILEIRSAQFTDFGRYRYVIND